MALSHSAAKPEPKSHGALIPAGGRDLFGGTPNALLIPSVGMRVRWISCYIRNEIFSEFFDCFVEGRGSHGQERADIAAHPRAARCWKTAFLTILASHSV
uniref:Uncharacterized protein n=1 Tax=Candidatus Kentrum sp. SD TaxID=2126332 RepID=A0A450YQE1_9GAMM|nr:MAG: hypothetical protein BECKSD772F_GA0070984_11562 [Candidatus Kentron sp. SD]VFK49172.1 MAG: hypothetical protein BECKSD772E_GA0070983_11622 [Candidatus Kentron sp. SD]VFK78547.1 MAG: hypothetical protein BECKSD772D_GA0070982_101729 [Candidatus Kentron sp. SD]